MVNLYHDTMPKSQDAITWPSAPLSLRDLAAGDEEALLDGLIEGGYMLCGTPDEVSEQIAAWGDVGMDQLVFGLPIEGMHHEEVLAMPRALRRQGDPRVRQGPHPLHRPLPGDGAAEVRAHHPAAPRRGVAHGHPGERARAPRVGASPAITRNRREDSAVTTRRIEYAGSVHDQREIDAVVEVLQGGPTALRIGRNVRAMEQRVAELFGKRRGVMCNSGSSALYLAIDVLGLEPGDEIVTSAVTFSTDIAPMIRARLVPAFVDVTPTTFQIDTDAIEEMIGPRTKAILAPNLIGNAPDWDVIAEIVRRHGLRVVEDSCDALGLTLRGTPTGTRSDISLTSFALSHIITAAGTGGMVCFDDDALADQALLLRRWGRRSEVQLFGSAKGVDTRFFSTIDGDLEYDNLFIFDEVGWNFEPSELSAAFGLVQLDKLDENLKRRQRNFELTADAFARHPEHFTLPSLTPGVTTGWHMFPVLVNAGVGHPSRGVPGSGWRATASTRAWCGRATRPGSPRSATGLTACRAAGLPNADRVMEWGVVLPNNHSMSDDDCAYIGECVDEYLGSSGRT